MNPKHPKPSLVRSIARVLVVAGIAGTVATPTWADLTGTTVHGNVFYNDNPTPYNFFDPSTYPCFSPGCTTGPTTTIGSGYEFAYYEHDNSLIADFDATSVSVSTNPYFTFDPTIPFGPLTFEFKDAAFVGSTLSLLSFAHFPSADKFTYSLSGETITIRIPEYFITTYENPYVITIGIATAPVPEPSTTLAIMGGLLLLVFGVRRRSRRHAPPEEKVLHAVVPHRSLPTLVTHLWPLVAVAGVLSSPAQAGLNGSTVTGSAGSRDIAHNAFSQQVCGVEPASGTTATVGSGTEFFCAQRNYPITADLTDTTLNVEFAPYSSGLTGIELGPLTFTFQDAAFLHANVSLLSFGAFASPDQFVYSLSGDLITITAPSFFVTPPDIPYSITLRVETVPEPSTTLAILGGLLTLAYAARRHSLRLAPGNAVRS